MALFTKREVKEGKPIIANELRYCDLNFLRGARWEDYSDKDFISFVCDEDNFGPGFKKYLGYGNYNGSVSVSYSPDGGYIRMEMYFGANTISVSAMRSNADFISSIMGFDVDIMAPGTNGLRYPNVCVSKMGVSFSELKNQFQNLIITAAQVVNAD